jgi:hypothetical protein|eukprot:7391666-Prymnesium_polylepis.3
MNGSLVPQCWNPHIKTLGYVAYILVAIEVGCRFLFARWLKGRLEGAGNKVGAEPDDKPDA